MSCLLESHSASIKERKGRLSTYLYATVVVLEEDPGPLCRCSIRDTRVLPRQHEFTTFHGKHMVNHSYSIQPDGELLPLIYFRLSLIKATLSTPFPPLRRPCIQFAVLPPGVVDIPPQPSVRFFERCPEARVSTVDGVHYHSRPLTRDKYVPSKDTSATTARLALMNMIRGRGLNYSHSGLDGTGYGIMSQAHTSSPPLDTSMAFVRLKRT